MSESRHVSRRLAALCCALGLALLACGCAAASRTADPNRPRAATDAPPYPLVLEASEERREKALAAWSVVAGEQAAAAGAPRPELRPVTATIGALPPSLTAPPRMPKVSAGDARAQNDEETRESLRRFVETAAPLLGLERRPPAPGTTERASTLGDLSLVEVTGETGGTRLARYRQNPFDLPLRNGFGAVEIGFTPDLRVTSLTSTAVPDTERLRRAVAATRQTVAQDKLAAALLNRALTFTDAAGNAQTRTVAGVESVVVRDLVVFPQQRAGDPTRLELRLAWELALEGASAAPLLAYVDAVTGEQLTETGR